MASVAQWMNGARPRTLPAAVVPVAIGIAVVAGESDIALTRITVHGGLALLVSLALQIAVNYANDYSDGVRGTDDERVGPLRLVASGVAPARAVKYAALLSFAVAAVAGGVLAMLTTWWLIPVGLVSMIAGWTYTGGPKPYGYVGLGEVFVFVFFGLVATAGTAFVITETLPRLAVVSGAVAGFLAVALLVVNNIRDIESDRVSGKKTLAVRLGDRRSRHLYVAVYICVAVAIVVAAFDEPLASIGLVGLLAALPAISTVHNARTAPELIRALGMTARAQLIVGGLYVVGLVIQ